MNSSVKTCCAVAPQTSQYKPLIIIPNYYHYVDLYSCMGLVTSYAGLTKKREKVEAKKCFEKQSGNDPLIRRDKKKKT